VKTRLTHLLCSIALLLSGATALAAELPFNQAQFEQAKTAGRPVVVFFHADWCPTCRVQQPIIQRLSAEPQFKPLTIFVADYDSEVALEKALHVGQQSTLVVFRRGVEVTRSTGQTAEAALRATLQQAL
jgi:thioredoxin 1